MRRIISLALMFGLTLSAGAAVTGYFLEIESYDMDVTLHPDIDQIDVVASMEIVNHTFQDLETLDLYVHYRAEVTSAIVDGKEGKFDNIGIRNEGVRQLAFELEQPLAVDDTIQVSVTYTVAFLQESDESNISAGATHLLIGSSWVPFLHRGDSQYGIDYAPVHAVVRTLPNETVVMPGTLLREERGEECAEFEWQSHLAIFPMLLSGAYRTVEVTDDEGRQAVGYLFEDMPESADESMRLLLTEGLQILDVITEMYGPLPDAPLRISSAHMNGGMGFPLCLVLSADTFDLEGEVDRQTFEFLSHELAHSWYPGLLRPRGVPMGLTTEAMASYTAAVVTEQMMGEDASRRTWDRYQEEVRRDEANTIPLLEQGSNPRTVYDKGAYWWRTLERRLGRERLWSLWRTYTQEHALESVPFGEIYDWMNEQTPDIDLTELHDWYLRTNEIANVGIGRAPHSRPNADGGVTVDLDLTAEGLPDLPLDIEIRLAGGTVVSREVTLGDVEDGLEIELPAEPIEVILDPGRWLLQAHAGDDRWPREQDSAAFYREAAAAWASGNSEAGLEPIAQALARQPENPQFLLMAGQLLVDAGYAQEARELLEQARELLESRGDESITRAWVLVALGRACQEMGLIDDAKAYYFQVPATEVTRRAHAEAQILLAAISD